VGWRCRRGRGRRQAPASPLVISLPRAQRGAKSHCRSLSTYEVGPRAGSRLFQQALPSNCHPSCLTRRLPSPLPAFQKLRIFSGDAIRQSQRNLVALRANVNPSPSPPRGRNLRLALNVSAPNPSSQQSSSPSSSRGRRPNRTAQVSANARGGGGSISSARQSISKLSGVPRRVRSRNANRFPVQFPLRHQGNSG